MYSFVEEKAQMKNSLVMIEYKTLKMYYSFLFPGKISQNIDGMVRSVLIMRTQMIFGYLTVRNVH